MRKILRMKTTYVNPWNTNEEVLKRANEAVEKEGGRKIKTMEEYYRERRLITLASIFREEQNSERRYITFKEKLLEPREFDNKRVGAPKYKWYKVAMKEYWGKITCYITTGKG